MHAENLNWVSGRANGALNGLATSPAQKLYSYFEIGSYYAVLASLKLSENCLHFPISTENSNVTPSMQKKIFFSLIWITRYYHPSILKVTASTLTVTVTTLLIL